MTTSLSPAAQQLLARLSAPKPDHEAFVGTQEPSDISSLSREELGAIWVALDRAYFSTDNPPARQTAYAIRRDVFDAEHWPLMTDAQVLAYLERADGEGRNWTPALEALAWRADSALPLPAKIVQQLRRILGEIKPSIFSPRGWGGEYLIGRDGGEALYIARHLQQDEGGPEVTALVQMLRQSCAETHYKQKELELFLTLTREELRMQHWPMESFNYRDDPRYRTLFESVLRDACARVEAIHRGEVPYVGYKAFADGDADVIAQAYRFAALRNEPWLAALTHQLLLLVSHAPDGKSKSLPSQTVCCRLAEEIMKIPTPQGIASLQDASKLAINATVKSVLAKRIMQAKTAMALRPDVVLGLVASGEPDKKQQTMLATLLQASYWTALDFSLADWRVKLCLSSGAGAFTQSLIWLAQQDGEGAGLAFMAEPCEGGLRLTDCHGAALQIADSARIRLWHPLHASHEERQAWQQQLTRRQLRQPLRQAFREYYEPLAEELERPSYEDAPHWTANESQRFAELMLSLRPLIGLARREGWKIDKERGLVRLFGTLTVIFEVGAELYPGVGGDGESMFLTFWNHEGSTPVPIKKVPPVLYSEACRAVDLLVSVTAYADRDGDPRGPISLEDAGIYLAGEEPPPPRKGPEHPVIKRWNRLARLGRLNIADMTAMRGKVLAQAFAAQVESGQLVFEGRLAKIGEYRVHLSTAMVSRNGEQVALKLPKPGATGKGSKLAALPWLPYDEVLLEKLAATLAALL